MQNCSGQEAARAHSVDESQPLYSSLERDGAENACRERDHRFGLACTVTSALIFGIVAAMAKGAGKPVFLMMYVRLITQWALSFVFIAIRRSDATPLKESLYGPSGSLGWLVFRGVLYWCFNTFWWCSIQLMPLGDSTAIVYTTPVYTALFSFCLLGESLDAIFFVCALVGFAGVLLIVQPSNPTKAAAPAVHSLLGPILAISASIVGGLLPAVVRKVRRVHWTAVEHVTATLGTFVLSPGAIVAWLCIDKRAAEVIEESSHSMTGWILIILASMVEFIGLGLQTTGYQRVNHAATASLMNYVEVPFAFMLQSALFGRQPTDPPIRSAITGATLILASGASNLLLRQHGEPN